MKYKIMGRYSDNYLEHWVMVKLEDERFGVVDTKRMKKFMGCNCTFDLLRGGNSLVKEITRETYEKVLHIMEDDTQEFEYWNFLLGRQLDDLSLDDIEAIIVD